MSYYDGYRTPRVSGTLNLTETSPAQSFTEPLTLEEVRRFLKDPPDDDNDQIEAFIAAAREQAEYAQGRDLVRKQWDLNLDYWPAGDIELRDPLVSVQYLKLRDYLGNYTTMADNADYIVDVARHPGIITRPYNVLWPSFTPWPVGAVQIRFTSGVTRDSSFWTERPLIKQGMKLLIAQWFENRLPFVVSNQAAQEYPFAITNCLGQGALERVV